MYHRIDSAFSKIISQRIQQSVYWKEKCVGIDAVTFCDRGADITAVGGVLSSGRVSQFLSLVYKLSLLRPPREIVEEMLTQHYFKYLAAIAAFYIRLHYKSSDVYTLLEPMLADYRKLKWQLPDGTFKLGYMDEFVHELLTEERMFGLSLPRLVSRVQLEDQGLEPREPLLSSDEDSS